jgi:hypothetical protein
MFQLEVENIVALQALLPEDFQAALTFLLINALQSRLDDLI